jgi:hypothetical protein
MTPTTASSPGLWRSATFPAWPLETRSERVRRTSVAAGEVHSDVLEELVTD